MKKKKKKNSKKTIKIKNSNVSTGAKRTIVAILFVILAVIFMLGFFKQAGVIGEFLTGIVGKIFGFTGKFLAPLVSLFIAFVLVRKKKMSFYITKIVGILVVFVSLLALFHIHISLENFKTEAFLGHGGGLVGYGIAVLLITYTGKIVSIVILLGLVIIGGIIAFDKSFVGISDALSNIKIPKKKKKILDDFNEREELDKKIDIPEPEQIEDYDDEEELSMSGFDDEDISNGQSNVTNRQEGFVEDEKTHDDIEKDTKKDDDFNNVKNKNFEEWLLPSVNLLDTGSSKPQGGDIKKKAKIIEETFSNFNINMELEDIVVGPTVTQFSFRPQSGVKLSKITTLSADLALALAAHTVRIEAPIPGKSLIGIEVPNKKTSMIRLRTLLSDKEFINSPKKLLLALGKDINGDNIFEDLAKMPHLLVAGATGAGKSVTINSIILSLLYKNSPQDLKMILVDPKRVELSLYNGIPHLLSNVITDNSKVVNALKWAVTEMERRYTLLEKVGTRDLKTYKEKRQNGETYEDIDENGNISKKELENLPFIVIIIDEMADLMGTHSKDVEGVIVRLAQMSRAVGIHLILSTQRPSVEVITGTIKANLPTRIALRVTNGIDSRTIIDRPGAEKLVGNGDMLFTGPTQQSPHRLQGVYVNEDEVKRVIESIKKQAIKLGANDIDENFDNDNVNIKSNDNGITSVDFDNLNIENSFEGVQGEELDELFEEAKEAVIKAKKASTSYLQRRLKIGYSRAARIIDQLEENGIVGPSEGSKGRKILLNSTESVSEKSPMEEQVERDEW